MPSELKRVSLRAGVVVSFMIPAAVFAAGPDTQRIGGPAAKALLGDGTGVIVGIVDSGVTSAHPALNGTVSNGQPRLVAAGNFVTSESTNTGADVYGHGTAVAGQILSRDATYGGIATDARYINARVLDSTNSFSSDAQVVNGVGFALANGANLINMSLGYGNSNTAGLNKLALMADYISYARHVPMVISAGNAGTATNRLPQGPGDAYNVFSVASTSKASNWSQVVSSSSYGPTTDGRNKPDLSAPGDQIVTASNSGSGFTTWSGTSFAAPNAAGMLAAQMDYGMTRGLSVDPLVLKTTMMNSAEKIRDRNGAAQTPANATTVGGVYQTTSPLNASAGAGQVNGQSLFNQYSPGDLGSGDVAATGWDLASATAAGVDYHLGQLAGGSTLATTLGWDRHVGWTDVNGDGVLNSADSFSVTQTVTNLDLYVYRDDVLIARSISGVDNVEALTLTNLIGGDYDLRVVYTAGTAAERYALAWSGVPVPEPTGLMMAAVGGLVLRLRRRPRTGAGGRVLP